MQAFLLKTCAWILLALGLHAFAGTRAGGSTDEYYLRFTAPRQHALIIGGSRASRGLHPDILDSALQAADLEGPLYNFAFTIGHSPYGPTYTRAVRAKLDPATTRGLFLVEVSPWLLVQPVRPDPEVPYVEAQRALGEQWCFNMDPNYEYLVRHRERGWGSLLRPSSGWATVREDGRLYVEPVTAERKAALTAERIAEYREGHVRTMRYALERETALADLVKELQRHGRVVLVRLPVIPALLACDDSVAPDFVARMRSLARSTGCRFIDLMALDGRVDYPDGSHLDEGSGAFVSRALADSLLSERP